MKVICIRTSHFDEDCFSEYEKSHWMLYSRILPLAKTSKIFKSKKYSGKNINVMPRVLVWIIWMFIIAHLIIMKKIQYYYKDDHNFCWKREHWFFFLFWEHEKNQNTSKWQSCRVHTFKYGQILSMTVGFFSLLSGRAFFSSKINLLKTSIAGLLSSRGVTEGSGSQ